MAEGLSQNDPVQAAYSHPEKANAPVQALDAYGASPDRPNKIFNLKSIFKDKVRLGVVAVLFAGVLLLIFGAGLFFIKGMNKPGDEIQILGEQDTSGDSIAKIVVHVDGAVVKPGVYELGLADARVNDLIAAAGGLSKDADTAQINLAAKVVDGQKIHIRSTNDTVSSSSQSGNLGTNDTVSLNTGLVNVNTATEAQLDTLPSVGPVTAAKIIASRPYATLEELVSKKAVGAATFEKIKEMVTAY